MQRPSIVPTVLYPDLTHGSIAAVREQHHAPSRDSLGRRAIPSTGSPSLGQVTYHSMDVPDSNAPMSGAPPLYRKPTFTPAVAQIEPGRCVYVVVIEVQSVRAESVIFPVVAQV